MYRSTFLLLALSLALTFQVHGDQKSVSVLTIGNSFAENALGYLPKLAESAGRPLIVGRANLGGCTLERHWNHAAAFEADPESKEGSPYGKGTRSLDQMLKSRKWDYITLQQVSFKSHDLSTYNPYFENLYQYIKERAPNSAILLHQIWAYRVDDPRFVPKNKGKEPHTHREMYQQVRNAYHTIAKQHELGILPSGDAMYIADTDPKWGYQPDSEFDFKNEVKPNLPDQSYSLHTGWYWKKGNENEEAVLRIDGHHANRNGEYLIGCVWFETLFGDSVVNNSFVPDSIDPEYARFLRKTAHQAVEDLKVED